MQWFKYRGYITKAYTLPSSAITWFSFLPFVVTLIVAMSGWLFTYFHSRKQAEKRARLELVDKKLRLLYGPLYARLLAGNAAWTTFSRTRWPSHRQGGYFTEGYQLTEKELETWRHWMKHVFHPMNKKLESIIVDHIDLLENDEVPDAFTKTLARIHVYDAVLKAWDAGDYSEHTSVINFPAQELLRELEPHYRELRPQQAALSGIRRTTIEE